MGAKAPVDITKIETETTVQESDDIDDEPVKVQATKEHHVKKDRVYRKRKSSGQDPSEDDDDEAAGVDIKTTAKKAHIQSNLDADSDFSIDSDSDEEGKRENEPKKAQHHPTDVPTKDESQPTTVTTKSQVQTVTKDEKAENVDAKVAKDNVEDAIVDECKDEPKIDRKKIWEKRTVGDVLVGAIQRYFERKLLREG